jgi:uncharacterized membrane protein YeaQ/YmgE (transglycosylase-associated protein family)
VDLGFFGWIFVGLIAGSVSGWFVGSRSVSGCLPTMLVGIVGGVIGGWLAGAMGLGRIEGLIGALVFATVGAVLVRLVLRAIERDR